MGSNSITIKDQQIEEENKYICTVRANNFSSQRNYNIHIGGDDICSIFHKLEAIMPNNAIIKDVGHFGEINLTLKNTRSTTSAKMPMESSSS